MIINYQKKITLNLIKLCIEVIILGVDLPWDQKIAPVNQVWLLNQVLLYQEKSILLKPIKFWDLGIMVAKSEMLLNQVPIRQ